MKNLIDKVVVITGATDGIGKLTAKKLAEYGARVHIHGRSSERIENTVKEIIKATGNDKVAGHQADFSSFTEIRQMATELLSTCNRIDVLINNAGMGGGEKRTLSKDNIEMCFQVNYLSTFLLTHLLLPKLKKSTPARIVNVASLGQFPIDFDNVMLESDFEGLRAYRQSKLAMIMFGFDLAKKLENSGITVNSLHPGSLLGTKIAGEMFNRFLGDAKDGVEPIIHLAAAPELENINGKFFDGKNEVRAHEQAYDEKARQKVWLLGLECTQIDK